MSATTLLMRTIALSFNIYLSARLGSAGMGLFTLVSSVYSFAATFALSGVNLASTRLTAQALGRESVARIAALGETGSDTSPHCGSASSATHKKILLVLALGRDLAITIPPMESADAETLTALSECIARALARR